MRILIITLLVLPLAAASQHEDPLLDSVDVKGKVFAQVRTFFMATINKGDFRDYHALVAGGALGYKTPEFKRFRMGVSGSLVRNLASSDLSKPDLKSGTLNRYEVGLMDMANPGEERNLLRLEELFVQYRINRSFLRVGKIILNTPFINPQDGRMRPTAEQGLWAEVNAVKDIELEAGFLTHVSPRSTVKWYRIAESVGIYPSGVGVSGMPSNYGGHVKSKGIFLLGFNYKKKAASFTYWTTFIENVSHTAFGQVEQNIYDHRLYAALQYTRQDAAGDGGNSNEARTYMLPNTHTNIFSGRVGVHGGKLDVNFNGTIINGTGRFLMPREWGREPFYTFLPRERNEGTGQARAISADFNYAEPKIRLKSSLGIGHYALPSAMDYHFNKYTVPSYTQMNVDLRYDFNGSLNGAGVQILYVYKLGTGNDFGNPKNIVNKINMSNFNVVLNYRFEKKHAFRRVSANSYPHPTDFSKILSLCDCHH